MTPEERAKWEQRRADAKAKLAEIAPVRTELKKTLKHYDEIFQHEANNFAEADRRLAMADDKKYKKVDSNHPKGVRKVSEYNPEELLRLLSNEQKLELMKKIKEEK